MFKKLIGFVLLLGSAFSNGKLVAGTNAEFPPFTYIEKGVIIGFDIDIAKEVAKRLGKEIEWKDMPFDALIPEVVLGRVDFVAAGLSYTEERAKRVLFTKSYLSGDLLVILSKQKLGLEDLKGKTVAVVEGFTADLFMSLQKGTKMARLPSQTDGFLALKNSRADAFVTAKTTVSAFVKTQDASEFQITPVEGTAETCALIVPKSKPDLLEEIQKVLDAMEEDGAMADLKNKWGL